MSYILLIFLFIFSCLSLFRVSVKDEDSPLLLQLLTKHSAARNAGTLLLVEFTTLSEYLYLLQASAEALGQCGAMAALYLAAAVSDFYIPSSNMVSLVNRVYY